MRAVGGPSFIDQVAQQKNVSPAKARKQAFLTVRQKRFFAIVRHGVFPGMTPWLSRDFLQCLLITQSAGRASVINQQEQWPENQCWSSGLFKQVSSTVVKYHSQ
jgi:hypothetical protein